VQKKWDELQAAVGVSFKNVGLLKQAFTHASYRNEHRKSSLQDNERLEFLGDAVLEVIVSDYLFRTRPDLPEGELTRLRANIVCEASLVVLARHLGFESYIRLGRGEERSGGRGRPALLADVFEAFVGALYLDQGFVSAQGFANAHIFPHLDKSAVTMDYKTGLQEWVQQNLNRKLNYEIVEERGPAHAREFVVQVRIGGEVYGVGAGRSKKEAEQRAAAAALCTVIETPDGGMTHVSQAD
jgi:ribonuclease III